MIINNFSLIIDQFSLIIDQLSHAWGGLPGRVPDPNYKIQVPYFSLLGGLEFGGLFGLPLGLQKLRKWSSKYRKLLPILDPGDLGSTTRLLGGLAEGFSEKSCRTDTDAHRLENNQPQTTQEPKGPPRTA